MLDIDDFKLYNELYGAQESDNLIHRFAQVILQEISSKDIGFRFGADEFLILKAGTDIDEACSCCKRIVDAITDATPANTVWISRSPAEYLYSLIFPLMLLPFCTTQNRPSIMESRLEKEILKFTAWNR